jgi:hypothetical protein
MPRHRQKTAPASDEEAVERAHAVYTPFTLSFYDLLVHRLSNHLIWRCPTRRLLALYEANLTRNHFEAGVGTGFFLDRAGDGRLGRLVLLDINHHCLNRAARRLARFEPALRQANLLAPLETQLAPFDSVGLTYVLHCLPGRMDEKLAAIDHLCLHMNDGAVLFGATILGRGTAPNAAAQRLLAVYNKKGVFNNRDDDLGALSSGLKQRFDEVEIEAQGCVVLFRAS